LKKQTFRDKFYLYRHGGWKMHLDKVKLSFINSNKIKILSVDPDKMISKVNRFTVGERNLFDRIFEYVDLPSFEFIFNEVFQLEIYKFETESKNPLIIDCGANIGLSVLYFKQLYPNSKIIAFEPDHGVFNCLQKNIESYNLSNVELHNSALWDVETELDFFNEGADGGRLSVGDQSERKKVRVKTTLLSTYINEKVDFLKIDIEGAEFNVLSECADRLFNVDHLFIEYHSFEHKDQNLGELLSLLKANGFRYYVSSIGIKSPFPYLYKNTTLGMDNQLNIFASKTKKA
jgi:FkbM family methyltransferase